MPLNNAVYGIHAVEELLSKRMESVDHVYFDKNSRNPRLFNLIKKCRKERLVYNLVPAQKISRIAGTEKHQGVTAQCSILPYCSLDDLKKSLEGKTAPLLLLSSSVEDPQNLGALIRSCVAFGVDALLLERKNTSPLSSAVAKASAGMIEHCRIVRPKNLEGVVREFAEAGFSVIGTRAFQGVPPAEVDLKRPLILILGGEHCGIPPYLEKQCSCFISIPIDGKVNSLNVSAACAVILYECMKQRMTS